MSCGIYQAECLILFYIKEVKIMLNIQEHRENIKSIQNTIKEISVSL